MLIREDLFTMAENGIEAAWKQVMNRPSDEEFANRKGGGGKGKSATTRAVRGIQDYLHNPHMKKKWTYRGPRADTAHCGNTDLDTKTRPKVLQYTVPKSFSLTMATTKTSLMGYRQTVVRDSRGLLKPGDEITTRQHSRSRLRKKDRKREVSDQKRQF